MSYILEKKLQSIHLVFRGHWERPSSGLASLILRASLVAQMVKSLPVMLETWVLFLGQEDSPGEGNWQPTPVFLSGKSHEWRSLAGYSPWGHKELDTTERLPC